jgi:methylenetetrahydrofolate dehydrogenase (NADP+)/methenyltetrahydrofolate cyclohydrolase
MTTILKGIDVVNHMKERLIAEVAALRAGGIEPRLALVRIGESEEDLAYERMALKRCESVGVTPYVFAFEAGISHEDFLLKFKEINADEKIHGILCYRPFPANIDERAIRSAIDPQKDIDCMSPDNIAKLFIGETDGFNPCTPEAVMAFLEFYGIGVEGKNVVIVGRSMVVGRPLSMLMLKKNATVTICHTKTADLKKVCRGADILVAAVGRARMFDASYVSPGTVVIDVGMNSDGRGGMCGDVDTDTLMDVASAVSPVPGGIGTVTNSILVSHVIRSASLHGR